MRTLLPVEARRSSERLRAHLSPADRDRVLAILGCLDAGTGRSTVAAVLSAAFPGASLEAQNKGLTRLREKVAEAAADASFAFELRVTEAKVSGAAGREVWFEGIAVLDVEHETPELDQAGARLVVDTTGIPLGEPRVRLTEWKHGKPVVRWFFSYAHADTDARDLYDRLALQLGNSARFHFVPWNDGMILVGEEWDAQIHAAMRVSHIGVLAISHAFLGSGYITREELPAFVRGKGAGVPGKRAVPVALKATNFANTDMKGLSERQLWRDADGKAFVERKGARRDAWVAGLVDQLVRLLEKYADGLDDTPPPGGGSPGRKAGIRMALPDIDGVPCLMEDAIGAPASFSQLAGLGGGAAAPDTNRRAEPVVAYVREWLDDPEGPPLFALLGEYGMGKTITCQRVVREIEHAREGGAGLPQPLYFDLRRLTGLRERRTPTLREIIDECIERGWSPAPDVPHPTAAELIKRAKTEPLLFVFDGLDEALVHLTEVDGQAFTQEILKLRPNVREGVATAPMRLLISCRTHYFRSLQDQNNHFTGQERGSTEAQHYRAMLLLPLTEVQIRGYFAQALPGLDADRTLELVKSVHNLTELASRPYTLRLVTEFIPEIERLRALGRPVYGVTLYRAMVERWMMRDKGKHHLQPDHKLRLMTHLAAWMFQRGQRVIAASELEPWFHAWLDGQADLRRYRDFNVDKLEEDLRTATFLVREDGEDGKTSGFRFAHTSMLEFFLSRHLFEAVRDNRRAGWALPKVSDETLDFFAQHLQEAADPALIQRLGTWGAPYLSQASELWLAYAVRAHASGWPAPNLGGADLSGADLQGQRFEGTAEAPLNFTGSRWVGTNLRETRWRHVRLDAADLTRVDLRRAEWQEVVGRGASLDHAECDGATFRRCDLEGATWEGAVGHRARFIFTSAPMWVTGAGAVQVAPVPGGGVAPVLLAHTLGPAMGHTGVVAACAFSPDGTLALSASWDSTLRLWDTRSGHVLAVWSGHTGRVNACAFSPDGTLAVSASGDGTLRLWDVRSGRSLDTWSGHAGAVNACALSPDGTQALSASDDRTLRLWDARSGRALVTWSGHTNAVNACAFSPDGTRGLSASHDRTLRLWDIRSGHTLATWSAHTDSVTACTFSPDGTRALSASRDHTLRLWDARSGHALATWTGHEEIISACVFSPDGARALSAGRDGSVRLWDSRSGQTLAAWSGHTRWVSACAFSSDGARALSGSWDYTLRLWDARSGRALAVWNKAADVGILACAFSRDGTELLSATRDTFGRWDARSGRSRSTGSGPNARATACAFSRDGALRLSASPEYTLRLRDTRSGHTLATWTGHTGVISACAFSADGTQALSASYDKTLRVWDARSGASLATLSGHTTPILACAFSPDGLRALSGDWDDTLRLWDVRSGKAVAIWTGHSSSVSACAFSPDGALALSGSWDQTLRLWEVRSGRMVATWAGHTASVTACAFSPDGTQALSASYDRTLRLWDTESGKTLAIWSGHTAGAATCAFSPDGTQAVSGGDDGTLRLWDVATGRCLRITQLVDDDHAVWTPGDETHPDTIIEASENAWRWLSWQGHDADGNPDSLPGETFGPLPPPRLLGRA